MKFLIFAGAEIYDYSFIHEHLSGNFKVICCDGGVKHTKKLNIIPDYINGDFDSADEDILLFYKEKNVEFNSFPVKKDYTDLEICLHFALDRHATEILIFGAIGNRFDHTLTNAHLLKIPLLNNIKASLINENNTVFLINDKIILDGKKGDLLSLIPMSDIVFGVTTKGLCYPLVSEDLSIGASRGISNIFAQEAAEITINSGLLFVIKSSD